MSEQIWAVGKQNLITFQTNATWEQKVRISGTGIEETLTGRGEGVIHWQRWTGPGNWTITAWHRPPGSSEWMVSQLVAGMWERGVYYVGANDTGGDYDFNDVLISTYAITDNIGELLADQMKV